MKNKLFRHFKSEINPMRKSEVNPMRFFYFSKPAEAYLF